MAAGHFSSLLSDCQAAGRIHNTILRLFLLAIAVFLAVELFHVELRLILLILQAR
jgi:hypothetical protein